MSLQNLTNMQKVLFGKVIGDKAWKAAAKEIGSGETFSETLVARISGTLRIGAPYQQSIAQTFPWQRLALMLATRVSKSTLDAVMRDLRTAEAPGELKDHVIDLWAQANVDTQKMCSGKVTGRPTVEILELP